MEDIFIPVGSIVNFFTVVAGSLIGLSIKKNLPDRFRKMLFNAIGLATLVLGISMCLEYDNLLILVLSTIVGAMIGELLRIEEWLESRSELLKKRLKSKNEFFTEGLLTAFILFCLGPVTILGAINEGLNEDRTLIYTKSILDGFSSLFLASAYGTGVLLSAIPLLIFQVAITYGGYFMKSGIDPELTTLVGATGGIMILGLGLNLLEIKKIKIANLLPAIVVAAVLFYLT